MDPKVWLCPNYDIATKQKEALETDDHVVACVEAEYGDLAVEGTREELSLAHHGPREANPAPCIADNLDQSNPPTAYIVSHLDLDAVGGILALQGQKPEDDKFWQGAAFIDVNGPHHIHKLDQGVQDKLNAVYAWNTTQDRINTRGVTEPIDVTASVSEWKKALDIIVDERHPEHEAMIEAGRKWEREVTQAVEAKLVFENENVRAFITDGVFCASSYYSPNTGEVAPATVTLNTKFNAITVAFADGGKDFSARKIVQGLWGPEAGGRDGIAGSPRGVAMTMDQFLKAVTETNRGFEERQLVQETSLDNIPSAGTNKMMLFVNEDMKIEPTTDLVQLQKQLQDKYQIVHSDGYSVECSLDDSLDVNEVQKYMKTVCDVAERNANTGLTVGGELANTATEIRDAALEDAEMVLECTAKSQAETRSDLLYDNLSEELGVNDRSQIDEVEKETDVVKDTADHDHEEH